MGEWLYELIHMWRPKVNFFVIVLYLFGGKASLELTDLARLASQ